MAFNKQPYKFLCISASKTFEFNGKYGGRYEVVFETGTRVNPHSKGSHKFLSVQVFYELDVIGFHNIFLEEFGDCDVYRRSFDFELLREHLNLDEIRELAHLILERRDEIVEWLLENVDHSLLSFDRTANKERAAREGESGRSCRVGTIFADAERQRTSLAGVGEPFPAPGVNLSQRRF